MKKKTILRGLITIVLLAALFVISAYTYLRFALPDVGAAPDVTIERTPARIERGRYLVNNVAACVDCHSQRDFSKLAGPNFPDSVMPWKLYSGMDTSDLHAIYAYLRTVKPVHRKIEKFTP